MSTIHWSHKEEKYWIRDGDDILWFDGPLEAEAGQRYLETKKSINAEIALIANYFRKMGMTQVAMSIEAGDYKNEKQNP